MGVNKIKAIENEQKSIGLKAKKNLGRAAEDCEKSIRLLRYETYEASETSEASEWLGPRK